MPPRTIILTRILHYIIPLTTAVSASTLSVALLCFVPPSKQPILGRAQQRASKWLALAITVTYVVEAILFVIQGFVGYGPPPEDHELVYVVLSALLWLLFFIVLNDAKTVHRLTHTCTWILTTILELVLSLLSIRRSWDNTHFEYEHLAFQVLRLFLLVSLCANAIAPVQQALNIDRERQPLLQQDNRPSLPTSDSYGAVPQGDVETDDEGYSASNKHSEEQLQRLERLSGWWAYLKEFRIFLPHVVPVGCLKLQGFAIIIALLILSDRAANLLGPRLLGNIVQKLTEAPETPWGQISFLIFVIKLPHDLILAPLQRLLVVKFYYWSYGRLLIHSFEHIMGLSLSFHDNKKTGEVHEAINQAQGLSRLADDFTRDTVPLLLDLVIALFYLTHLFDVYLGLVLVATYVLYGIITYKLTGWAARYARAYRAAGRVERNILMESIANWSSAFYFNRQEYQKRRLEDSTQHEIYEMSIFYAIQQIKHMGQSLVMVLGYCAVLILASRRVTLRNQPVGDFVTLLLYWGVFTRPIFALTHTYDRIIELVVDAEALLQLHQTIPTVTDARDAHELVFKGGQVEYRNVSFSYDSQTPILKGLNFTVPAGSTLAIVGQTGSGKTTSCDKLLFRGYDVTEGSILIDDQDIRHVTQRSLRETVGIVRQEQAFYNDSVLEIVRFARLSATDEEVYEACRNAAIHNQILSFPNGYHSKIGERGVKLSGGERQRLAIAQLFLRDPKIIVLDEATSTVDNVTEADIQDAFTRICKGRTTIIIAHRLSTVANADQILVLHQGRIVERGTHDELLRFQGKYYQLWTKKKRVDKYQALARKEEMGDQDGFDIPPLDGLQDSIDDSSKLCNGQCNPNGSCFALLNEITQADGQSDSKPNEVFAPNRTSVRKLMSDLKRRFKRKRAEQDETDDVYEDEEIEGTSPIKQLSPRPTNAEPSISSKRRHSFSLRRRSRDIIRPSISASHPTSTKMQDMYPSMLRPASSHSNVIVPPLFSPAAHKMEEGTISTRSHFNTSTTPAAPDGHQVENEHADIDIGKDINAFHTPVNTNRK